MSYLNDDAEVLEGKRKPLKGVEAPLRDQIPEKLAAKLEELGVGKKMSDLWTGGNANRTELLNRQKKFLKDWDEFLVPQVGASKKSLGLHIPMPLTVAKTFHARMLQALVGIDPSFTVKPRTEAGTDRAPMVQELIRYLLAEYANRHKGIEQVLDEWIWDWITTGTGILKWSWECDYTTFVDVETVPKPTKKLTTAPDGTQAMADAVELVDEEVTKTIKTYEGPVLRLIHLEDFNIVGGEGDPDLADCVQHRDELTASQLWTLADRKIFREETVRKVIEARKLADAAKADASIKEDRARNAGTAGADTELDLDRYAVLESYCALDVEGNGINSEVVVWTDYHTGGILRATYLRRTNRAGERPFIKIDFHKRRGQDFGMGLIEMLHPLSRELDAVRNLRLDGGMLSTVPFFFYRPTSNIEAEEIEVEPGMGIPVDNPQTDVYFPNIGNRTAFGFQEEQSIQTMVERLTAISDLNLGVIGGQGATRTASGVRALLGENNANLDTYMRRMNRGYKKLLEYVWHTIQQRLPKGFAFRVTGDDGKGYWNYIQDPSIQLQDDMDFEISPNSANSNKAIQEEVASTIVQLTSNPLDIQLGIINPLNRFNAIKNLLLQKGVKDFSKYVTKPSGLERVLTPEEEANRVLVGIEVPVTAEMDHDGFISYVEHVWGDDYILGQFTKEQAALLIIQMKKHEQMKEALAQMAAQQANVTQMRMNAEMSQQQAPAGMSPMAGQGAMAAAPQAAA